MDAKKLSILVTAIDMGSFSKASEVVGYTQSGLTHLVDSLENELGIRLIVRNHSGISPTEDGKKLLPYIREYLKADVALENRIKQVQSKDTDTIRISAYSSITMHWMPEILYRFRRICPEVNVDLRMVDDALEPYKLLEEGKTDVIFASRQDFDSCDFTPLYNEIMYAILPKDYPIGDRTAFPLSEFKKLEFIMPYGRFDIEVNKALLKIGEKPLDCRPSRVDDETVIRMVSKGLGVSMMSELMLRGRTDDVLALPVAPTIIRELGVGTKKGAKISETMTKLRACTLDFIKDYNKKEK